MSSHFTQMVKVAIVFRWRWHSSESTTIREKCKEVMVR